MSPKLSECNLSGGTRIVTMSVCVEVAGVCVYGGHFDLTLVDVANKDRLPDVSLQQFQEHLGISENIRIFRFCPKLPLKSKTSSTQVLGKSMMRRHKHLISTEIIFA